MTGGWLLVETLGREPAVVALGGDTKRLTPLSAFLRRDPNLMAIQSAIGESVRAGVGLSSITSKNDCVIRTEVVAMPDGRIHGAQVWTGPATQEPPNRPVIGSLVWDLCTGVAVDTSESLVNSGCDPEAVSSPDMAFAGDLPRRELSHSEAAIVPTAVAPGRGIALCHAWDGTDYAGKSITVGFVARALQESPRDGGDRLVCRGMNWRTHRGEGPAAAPDRLVQQALRRPAPPGVHRALVELNTWTLVRWLDDPPSFFDWATAMSRDRPFYPPDRHHMTRMAMEFVGGVTSGVLRMSTADGDWTPVHVTVRRVELDDGNYAGLATMRLPNPAELATAAFESIDDMTGGRLHHRATPTRKARRRRARRSRGV